MEKILELIKEEKYDEARILWNVDENGPSFILEQMIAMQKGEYKGDIVERENNG